MIDVIPQQEPIIQSSNDLNKNSNLILIIVLVGLVLAIGVIMWIFKDILFTKITKQQNTVSTSKQITESAQTAPKITEASTSSEKLAFYSDTENGYSVQYPKTWFDIPKDSYSSGAKFFSTENVKKSDEISSNGTFLVMTLIKENLDYFKTLLNGEVGFVIDGEDAVSTKLSDTTVDGQKATIFSYETKTDDTNNHYYVVDYIVSKGDFLYSFAFITHNRTVFDKNTNIYKEIIASVKFL